MPSTTSINKPPDPTDAAQSTEEDQKEKKLTVLESHGYYLGKTIGTGSYATVRVAHSERHHGNVAIKIVSKFSAPSDYLKKFLPREIDVVKGLRHTNLIRFLQAIETTHRVYIVMEYADNGSLLDIIRKDHFIDEVRSRKWFRELVNAVEYCHEKGVVHRDIKCENMLMDTGWNVKLSDFGFARGELISKNGQVILSETYCGSYAYASPEILRGIPYQPQHADVWSMGVVLYAMVFGKLPFDDSNYRELLKQVSNKVVFPKEARVSTSCKSLISQILAPLKVRIRISGIRRDPWFLTDDEEPGTSGRKKSSSVSTESEDENKERKTSIDSKDIVQPHLITKELLDAEGKPRDKRRRSTLEENTINTQEPEATEEETVIKETDGKVTKRSSPPTVHNIKIIPAKKEPKK
ncbi:testis-specific serine/threonine-protein kinase 3 [Leptinotarsa decemlineata]|uniref:testis-specific serine/threonine-protein kinase 3 n=1 Tax=Leptinotarsa decemlineata TaxID=7539 RepID=UPI000C252F8A|nr:testis-specific serine/threonine-protein kinase 3-like [Leptinotarsa decemlineata]